VSEDHTWEKKKYWTNIKLLNVTYRIFCTIILKGTNNIGNDKNFSSAIVP
jgi:hypothetical protein